ncbi:MAG: hypothetical protein RI894_452, partial [Bacteroidota bacterium]
SIKIYTMRSKKINIKIADYGFCTGFNQTETAKKLIIDAVDDVFFMEIYPK